MTVGMVGNDPDELRALADAMRAAGAHLTLTWRTVDGRLATAPWFGEDAERFRREWQHHRRPTLADVATMLDEASATLIRNAEEQTRASAADGAATGSGGATGRTAQDYLDQALRRAGIDPTTWDPNTGVDGNRATIEAVYAYYAQLYRDNPEMLWAGMAALIGPSFYAGFRDLDSFADLARLARVIIDSPLAGGIPPDIAPGLRQLASMSAAQLEAEFRWYEHTFLGMQQEIFLDMGPQHEAYRSDGMAGIKALLDDGKINQQAYDAWAKIDEGSRTGSTVLVQEGNASLLRREQSEIIRDQYDAMYQRPVTGPALTYLATLVGQPSVPGAQGFADVFPLQVSTGVGVGPKDISVSTPDRIPFTDVRLPHIGYHGDNPLQGTATVTTPLPNGNIAHFDDRWALIEKDTLPAYLHLSRDQVLQVLQTPVGERSDQYTFSSRADDIARDLATDWQVDVKQ